MENYDQVSQCQNLNFVFWKLSAQDQSYPFFIPASNGFHFLSPVSAQRWDVKWRKDSSAGETPWFPDFLGLNFPIFQCQLSSNRRQEVCYNPFLLSHRPQSNSKSTKHSRSDWKYYNWKSAPPRSPEMAINSLIIVTGSQPPPRPDHRPGVTGSGVTSWGSAWDRHWPGTRGPQ